MTENSPKNLSKRDFLKGLASVAASAPGLIPEVSILPIEDQSLATAAKMETASSVAISPARAVSYLRYFSEDVVTTNSLSESNLDKLMRISFYLKNLTSGIPGDVDLFQLKVEKGGLFGDVDINTIIFNTNRYGFQEGEHTSSSGDMYSIFEETGINSVSDMMKMIFPGRDSITPNEIKKMLREVFALQLNRPMEDLVNEIYEYSQLKTKRYLIATLESIKQFCKDLDLAGCVDKIQSEIEKQKTLIREDFEKDQIEDRKRQKDLFLRDLKNAEQGSLEGNFNNFYFNNSEGSLNEFTFGIKIRLFLEDLGLNITDEKPMIGIKEVTLGDQKFLELSILDGELFNKVLELRR